MELKCCCKNLTPIQISNDDKKGERYECYYCKFKWRYIHVYEKYCSVCDDLGVNAIHILRKGFEIYVKCNLCGSEHLASKYPPKKILVYW